MTFANFLSQLIFTAMAILSEETEAVFNASIFEKAADELAEKGFSLTEAGANTLNRYAEDFKEVNKRQLNTVKEGGWSEGDLIVFPELAETLKRIAEKGIPGFYEGKTAELIVTEMKKGNGIITAQDLKDYESVWRAPLIGMYKDYKVIAMPPPSSGGWKMQTTVPSKFRVSARYFAAPSSIAVCPSWPQACMAPGVFDA